VTVSKIRKSWGEERHRRVRGAHAVRPKVCWQLQTAKAQFSEVFRRARVEGPQWVTRQNKDTVVILPAEDFERLARRASQPASLVRFFAESPLVGVGLDLTRSPDYGRDVAL
jgi:prevent-host-death family protein